MLSSSHGSVIAGFLRSYEGFGDGQLWLDDDVGNELQRDRDFFEDQYMDALVHINERYPDFACCMYFEIGGCTHGRRCVCGRMRAPWPWIVHRPGGPFCRCFLDAERVAWNVRCSLHRSKYGLFELQQWGWEHGVLGKAC